LRELGVTFLAGELLADHGVLRINSLG
jgi:hypothetical protein